MVGRGHGADLHLDEPVVSGLHAALRHQHGGWLVRDLGSRNGVFVNGDRITGEAPLAEGDRVGFGHAKHPWALLDAAPPVAFATALHGDVEVRGSANTLGLPDPSAEIMSISRTRTGWVAERDDELTPVQDRAVVEARGEWRLHLPSRVQHTTEAAATKLLDDADVRLVVSQDLEHIEVAIDHPVGGGGFGHYAANELLLVLAMAWIGDVDADPTERGWIHFDDLISGFRLTPMSPRDQNRVRQWIHQCRRRFEGLGFTDAERIVQRRAGSRQVRIGARHIAIQRPS